MAVPFKVKAVFEYASPHDDDLQFPLGQIITVTEEEDDDWYSGEYVDDSGTKHEGIFPRNFVEKYEPTAPPRPTRTRTRKDTEPIASPPPPVPPVELPADSPVSPKQSALELEAEQPAKVVKSPPVASVAKPVEVAPAIASPPPVPKATEAPPAVSSPPATKAAPGQSKPSGPPPVSDKPSGNAFRDRIAAFNKASAPPLAPVKPSGLGGAGFIKKPFVAPPPSRNAYVPPPREVPATKIYRRDEDPEIKEREQENQDMAEKAGLAPSGSQEAEAEDQPKPMSLKERMALLQRQQQEQAQRHAEAAAKKDKPKRPPKKRMESNDGGEEGDSSQLAPMPPLERQNSEDTMGRRSVDESQPPRAAHAIRRKSTAKGTGEPFDGNEADMSGAGDTTEGQEDVTERDDSDEKSRRVSRAPPAAAVAAAGQPDDEEEEDEDEDEEDDVDPEVRRKEELRARMAKLSGGMGMAGMFGMPMPGALPPPKKKKAPAAAAERRSSEARDDAPGSAFQAPPVPVPGMMALPGMSAKRNEDKTPVQEKSPAFPSTEQHDDDDETTVSTTGAPSLPSRVGTGPPPVPGGRPAPPPVPAESRPPPFPPMSGLKSPSAGSESDDELSERTPQEPLATPRSEAPPVTRAPPPPPPTGAPTTAPPVPGSPRSPVAQQQSFFGEETSSPTSPTAPGASSKRASRAPPPIPQFTPAPPSAQTRPPPPPPPGGLSRQSTSEARPLSPKHTGGFGRKDDSEDEEEVTEYEGDYDTDIASSVPHKDALKSHGRDSSIEDPMSPTTAAPPPSMPPPIPSVAAPRAPPPIPSQPAPVHDTRRSVDMPRAAPPPPPPPKETPQLQEEDEEYDPFRYSAPAPASRSGSYSQPPQLPPLPPQVSMSPEIPYSPPEQPPAPPSFQPPTPQTRAPPPGPPPNRAPPRQSLDVQRQNPSTRRSVDVTRPSMESGFVANEIDLAPQSGWWLQQGGLPPQLQGRKDIFFESEESQSAQQRGKTVVTRDLYILYQDYSQTVITVAFDPQNSSDVRLSQRHEPPPRSLRQDQLEQSYERFGRQISAAVAGKKETVVGDGTPQALVYDLLRPFGDALLPVGTRAYGALVYSNLANASTSQNDEIRPGDIMSVRNARFQGKHGTMHQKYSAEVGKPDHVAVVAEWDGTKKKVRAWEQGRESKKVKLESFKLDDLRSGEVKIWRVMPRSWVGWEGQN